MIIIDNLLHSISERFGEGHTQYEKYHSDPVGFCTEVFGETYTDDVKRIMESVRDNPVTLVQSANAVGKTHCASRIGTWFYKVFPEAQVYTTAAPPEGNLKKLLWGEISSLTEKHPELFKKDTINVLHVQKKGTEKEIKD